MAQKKNGNGWEKHSELVLDALKRNSDEHKALSEGINKMLTDELPALKIELATLKKEFQIKAGIWGSVAGLLSGLGALLLFVATKK